MKTFRRIRECGSENDIYNGLLIIARKSKILIGTVTLRDFLDNKIEFNQ